MADLGENETVYIRQKLRRWAFDDAVAFDKVPGFSNRNIFGSRLNVQTSGPFDLSPTLSGLDRYVFPDNAGESMELIADAVDSGTISIFVLDENQGGTEIRLDLSFSGDTPVPIPGIISRVNEAFVSGDTPITQPVNIRRVGGDNQVFMSVQVPSQRGDQCIYTVPRDKTAIIKAFVPTIEKSGGTNTAVTVCVLMRVEGSVFTVPLKLGMTSEGDTSPEFNNKTAGIIKPFTDIKIAVDRASQMGADVGARLGFRLKDVNI